MGPSPNGIVSARALTGQIIIITRRRPVVVDDYYFTVLFSICTDEGGGGKTTAVNNNDSGGHRRGKRKKKANGGVGIEGNKKPNRRRGFRKDTGCVGVVIVVVVVERVFPGESGSHLTFTRRATPVYTPETAVVV